MHVLWLADDCTDFVAIRHSDWMLHLRHLDEEEWSVVATRFILNGHIGESEFYYGSSATALVFFLLLEQL
jgi:hypothetical protein